MDDLRVLVVDDEEGMRSGAERVLRRHHVDMPEGSDSVGFVISQAATGEEAVRRIRTEAPDIVLLDYMLPGMNGLEVIDGSDISGSGDVLVIMISAYASIDTALKAARRGAYDFLAKPFTPDELKATVAKAATHIILRRRARALAAEKRQVRFQFISVLGHELKAPIGAVEGYVHMLKDRTLGEDVSAYDGLLDRCLARAAGMRKLILDLLDLTRIESGQKTRELAELDLVEATRAAIDTVAAQAADAGIAIALSAPEHLPIHGDEGEITMVLNNLITNAVKYNRPDGRVDVALTVDGRRVTIAVSDTGIGMEPEDVQRLFGEFVRVKNEHTRHIEGSGLGLSIVRKIAALYGGDVSVTSAPGTGSTFTVALNDAGAPGEMNT